MRLRADSDLYSQHVATASRSFGASQAVVWQALTTPAQVAAWWGPHGFTNLVCELVVHPGGTLLIDQRGPGGEIYHFTGVYHEVEAPDQLVFTQVFDERDPALVTFEVYRQGDRTVVTVEMRVQTVEQRDAMLEAGTVKAMTESLERLGDFLTEA